MTQDTIEEKDIKERIESFNKELPSLLGKYELGIGAIAKIMPDGRVGADPVILSTRKKVETPKVDGGLSNPEA